MPRLSGLTVLLVDDDRKTLERLVAFLDSGGAEVLQTHDAIEALVCLQSVESVDVVVTGISMGGIDGLELTERIRADVCFSSLPVIGLSEFHTEDVDGRAIFDALLPKPVNLEELGRRICYLTGRRKNNGDRL